MASPTDILASLQQGVVAINNFNTQVKGSFTNISAQIAQLTSLSSQITSLQNAQYGENIFINSGMDISQFNGANSVSLTTGTPTYITDQNIAIFTSSAMVVAAQQVTPPGSPSFGVSFQNALQIKATTGAALLAGDLVLFYQPIEGYRWERLGYGNASAQSVTIGFWVYATISGVVTVSIRNSASNRSYVTNVTINSSTTWEWHTVTIPGDTTGTWLSTNGVGAYVGICFGSGATGQGTNNTWQAGNFFATSSTTNFLASNANLVVVTGVAAFPGTVTLSSSISGQMSRTLDAELSLCQRYYEKSYAYATLPGTAAATTNENTTFLTGLPSATYQGSVFVQFKSRKRASPTVTVYSPVTGTSGKLRDNQNSADVTASQTDAGDTGVLIFATAAGAATGFSMSAHWVSDARM